jgi:hypothetical protein
MDMETGVPTTSTDATVVTTTLVCTVSSISDRSESVTEKGEGESPFQDDKVWTLKHAYYANVGGIRIRTRNDAPAALHKPTSSPESTLP